MRRKASSFGDMFFSEYQMMGKYQKFSYIKLK
jgi:hypothetical protein